MANRVGIVGAGAISRHHVKALLAIPGIRIVAVVDREIARARALAAEHGIGEAHADVRALSDERRCDVAHVLTPPDQHRRAAEPLLLAGIDVLVEKPLATSSEDARAMLEAARAGGACLGVNHSLVHHPMLRGAADLIASGRFGRLHHLIFVWNVPCPQLARGQLGAWMFRSPENVVFEQAVHPLSALVHLGGAPRAVRVLPSEPRIFGPGAPFHDTWQIALDLERASAQLFFSVGQPHRVVRLHAICSDGTIEADISAGRLVRHRRSHLIPPLDGLRDGLGEAWSIGRQSARGFAGRVRDALQIGQESDAYEESMRVSIERFHMGLAARRPPIRGEVGAVVVSVCEQVTRVVERPAPAPPPRVDPARALAPCDAVVLGGAGFIGKHTVRALLDRGLAVRVLARSAAALGDLGRAPGVSVVEGDALSAEHLGRALDGAPIAIDLLLPKSEAEQREQIVGCAERVAATCVDKGVRRLVYVSSIEALYLGDAGAEITGATGPDPRSDEREPYARGKAETERMLEAVHRTGQLQVCVLRPGIVIGAGGAALHQGVGNFRNGRHCMAWNTGDDPLPFVLVDDVAAAIVLAARSDRAWGRSYNLVGPVRLTGRAYVAELARALGRPIEIHPAGSRAVARSLATVGWIVKRAAGRREDFPYLRDADHARMLARFDCSDLERDLGWSPVADRAELVRRGIAVHAPPPRDRARPSEERPVAADRPVDADRAAPPRNGGTAEVDALPAWLHAHMLATTRPI